MLCAKPMIALTFDDGPSEQTLKILDVLEKYNAHASFFVMGQNAEEKKHIIEHAYRAGNEILNHAWSHKDLATLSSEEIKKELQDTENIILSIVGECPKLYRPPYGHVNETVKSVSAELGYSLINWSIDPLDWECKDPDTIYNEIIHFAHDDAIILCHDLIQNSDDTTPKAMERVIPALLEKYRLVTISELFKDLPLEKGAVYDKGGENYKDIWVKP